MYLSCLWIPAFSGVFQVISTWTVSPSLTVRSLISCRVRALWKVCKQSSCSSISTASQMICTSFNRYRSELFIKWRSENWVLNSVSSAVRWSEREKRTSYLTNKVRQSSNELLRWSFCHCFAHRCVVCWDLRSVVFGEFRVWLSEVLQVDLEATVDISCAKYEHTGKPSDHCSTNHWGVDKEMLCSWCTLSGFLDVSRCSLCRCFAVSRWWARGTKSCIHPLSGTSLGGERWRDTGPVQHWWCVIQEHK